MIFMGWLNKVSHRRWKKTSPFCSTNKNKNHVDFAQQAKTKNKEGLNCSKNENKKRGETVSKF